MTAPLTFSKKQMLWDLAKHNLRDRREFALTGGHSAILSLIKKGEIQALPPMEALYYAKETNVIERGATPGADMPAEERKEAGRIDCDEDETNAYDMSDEDWWSVFSKGANLGRKDAGYSVHEWMQHLIDLKKRDFRTITIMIFFAGERRQDDIQSQVERMAKVRNISVSVISVDLATDDRWDLASKETFHVILQMMKGFVDIVLGGPPCATVSRARKRESGKQMGFGYITWRYASPYLDKEELICGNTPKTQGKTRAMNMYTLALRWGETKKVSQLLLRLLRATGTDQLLFPYTYEQYRVLMGLPQHVVVPDEDSPSYLPQEAREPATIQEP
ncbi:unnamed protein product, partial [Effrenium voratum]